MRAEDDRIARLDGHDALEQHRRGGVRDRRQREDDSDGFGYFHQAALRKFANHADRALVLDVVVDELGGHHVLDGLVFEDAELGFLDRQARQMLGLRHSGQHHRLDDAVDILLGEPAEGGGGRDGLGNQRIEIDDAFCKWGARCSAACRDLPFQWNRRIARPRAAGDSN